jgi:protein-S-isoprenylcysteine O-methyltransferase Ste14
MKPSFLKHLRDIAMLPLTVTCLVPYLIFEGHSELIPDNIYAKVMGIIIGITGLALFLYTVLLFDKIGKGTLAPWSEKQKLIIYGPYRYCRNPMISGVLFIIIAEALLLVSLNILAWAMIFFIINTTYFIIAEEPALHKRFGSAYQAYKNSVPRWFPRFTPYNN